MEEVYNLPECGSSGTFYQLMITLFGRIAEKSSCDGNIPHAVVSCFWIRTLIWGSFLHKNIAQWNFPQLWNSHRMQFYKGRACLHGFNTPKHEGKRKRRSCHRYVADLTPRWPTHPGFTCCFSAALSTNAVICVYRVCVLSLAYLRIRLLSSDQISRLWSLPSDTLNYHTLFCLSVTSSSLLKAQLSFYRTVFQSETKT